MTAVRLNGEARELPRPLLAAALELLGLEADRPGVAVALNGEVVHRGAWARTRVRDGDEIEILTAVQGGC